jgi:hypothetical protein
MAPRSRTPAFSTTTSGGPIWRSTSAKKRITSDALDTSQRRLNAPDSSGARRDAQTAIRAPADASNSAQERPMPREAPVTTQTFPDSVTSLPRAERGSRAAPDLSRTSQPKPRP